MLLLIKGMNIKNIYDMPKSCDKIDDMKKPSYPKGDIRIDDPNLFYLGKDRQEYHTTDALEAANKRYFDEYFPKIGNQPTKPTGRRR